MPSVQGGQRKPWVLFVVVALAVLREGAETVLFVAGSLTGSGQVGAASVLLACALGLVMGAAVGAGLYAGLARIPMQKLFAATNVLIALLAASIASQLARALTQAGLVERGTAPLWDSSAWLAADSAPGALFTRWSATTHGRRRCSSCFYVAVLACIYIGTRLVMRTFNPLKISKRGASKVVVRPDDQVEAPGKVTTQHAQPLLVALTRAFYWQRLLDDDVVASGSGSPNAKVCTTPR